MELQCQLKVQEKMLLKSAEREEKNANKERNKAKKELATGNRDLAKLYATNAVRAQNQAFFLQQNAAKISAMVVDLKMSEVQKKMAKSLDTVVKEMGKSIGSMDLEKLAAATLKYDQVRGKVSEAGQMINATEGSVEAESANLLDSLENEILVEMDNPLNDIPTTDQPTKQTVAQGPSAA